MSKDEKKAVAETDPPIRRKKPIGIMGADEPGTVYTIRLMKPLEGMSGYKTNANILRKGVIAPNGFRLLDLQKLDGTIAEAYVPVHVVQWWVAE